MAEVILSPYIDFILGNLASATVEELQLGWGVDEELRNLRSTLSAIQAVLEDAEERQSESKAVQDWLRKLKGAAYDLDDLVDEMATEDLQSKAEGETQIGKKRKRVWDFFSSFFNRSHREMARRIRGINVRLEMISKEKTQLHLKARDGEKRLGLRERPPISSVMNEFEVFGREYDREQMIESLLSDNSGRRDFSVVAITGMGGLGKTTLAQVVYNDERITKHFAPRAWVYVSEDFDVKRLTKEIIESIDGRACNLSGIDTLQCCLRDKLRGKKFLLVLDDVWNENYSRWEQLQVPFRFGAKGSKILVTTRSESVSTIMPATCTYNLKGLSNQDCWSLFVSRAFVDETIDAYPKLIETGEKLVDRCQGLPLVAKALGGLLSSKRDVREWENILKSAIWDLHGEASEILPALRLSYQHLPAHLKRCFTFCSIFPKDHKFVKEELVQMWIAHGFIQPKAGKKIEDIGSEYFNDLLLRSFFQYLHDDNNTVEHFLSSLQSYYTMHGLLRRQLSCYTMHDLFHDLAQSISGSDCFQMEHGKAPDVLGMARHLSFSYDYVKEPINFEALYEFKGLRTFLLLRGYHAIDGKVLQEMFRRLKFIRVLDLSSAGITELPDSIGNLRHLRYLNLKSNKIKGLPESVCSFYNLQTLILSNCEQLIKLPNETRKLINLRHLDLNKCYNLLSMPPGIGKLTCLQTLRLFAVGRRMEKGIAELKELTDIHGMLSIINLENVAEAEEAQQANLKKKPFIDGLELYWKGRDRSSQDEMVEKEVTEGLQPHPNLKKLYFRGYMGNHFPSWMMKMDVLLPNLTTVELRTCRRCSILPPLWHLPCLADLTIIRSDEVKQIGHEFCSKTGGFPSLESLYLGYMLNLEQWHGIEEGNFPRLQRLTISYCPRLRLMPHSPLPNLTTLYIHSCAGLVSLPQMPSLQELYLQDLANLEKWCGNGEAKFPCLRKLLIDRCPKMTGWPSILLALTELTISYCLGFDALPFFPSLYALTLQGNSERLLNSVSCLTSLLSIVIKDIPELTSMPRGVLLPLAQLKELSIQNCDKLMSLLHDNGLKNGTLSSTLTNLILRGCPSLKLIPLHALTSLQSLEIVDCPQVTSLPEERLPATLQRLHICNCPMLEKRYLKDGGEDWPKI